MELTERFCCDEVVKALHELFVRVNDLLASGQWEVQRISCVSISGSSDGFVSVELKQKPSGRAPNTGVTLASQGSEYLSGDFPKDEEPPMSETTVPYRGHAQCLPGWDGEPSMGLPIRTQESQPSTPPPATRYDREKLGECRACRGPLQILDAVSHATFEKVACKHCGDVYWRNKETKNPLRPGEQPPPAKTERVQLVSPEDLNAAEFRRQQRGAEIKPAEPNIEQQCMEAFERGEFSLLKDVIAEIRAKIQTPPPAEPADPDAVIRKALKYVGNRAKQ